MVVTIMKSVYQLTNELHGAVGMLNDCLKAWGVPNGWDKVTEELNEELRQAQSLKESDIPIACKERSLKVLVLQVMGEQGEDTGRFAELELLRRLKVRKHATIQGPAALIHIKKGILQFSSIKRAETFSDKFLAYDVGISE